MYTIAAFGRMIADEVRMGAYEAAIAQAVRPGSVVLDIGAGTGILSLLACRAGARKVYAVETGDAIAVAQQIAQANGFADRIEFFQAKSTEITLPERADVIVSDLRGVLPLLEHHIPSIADARRRHLAPGGVLVPLRDELRAAIVEAPAEYAAARGAVDRRTVRVRHDGRPADRREHLGPCRTSQTTRRSATRATGSRSTTPRSRIPPSAAR